MFSAMSYGSLSYNAHESLARAAEELIYCITPVKAAVQDFYRYGKPRVSGGVRRCGVHPDYLNCGAAINQDGPGRETGHRRTSAGEKIASDISRTRMIPEEATPFRRLPS